MDRFSAHLFRPIRDRRSLLSVGTSCCSLWPGGDLRCRMGPSALSLWGFVRAFGWASIGMTFLVIAAGIKYLFRHVALGHLRLAFHCLLHGGWMAQPVAQADFRRRQRPPVRPQPEPRLALATGRVLHSISAHGRRFGRSSVRNTSQCLSLGRALFFGVNAVLASYFLRKRRLDQDRDLRPRQQ